ncbi:efflux transporter outer membrane subunit [Anaeromyxobacter sp. Fw109-5]|uniref:efflux transporter outer membrane subunit n=1 Tax=Anaeromyxobacter sp. (strain Fw109-5) TaxID=404589 RepID=UPI0000ED77BA|nr:efflux transporter outer membrane subunit [Anaeromyxobacter sp. Fw109-5]ABS24781.1 RND efflux system, outer membrane lipoprotein, NodT family [Anaeromyxobacter sp. Fw109-5]
MRSAPHARAALGAAAVLLAGCTLAPRYQRPPAPVAEAWEAGSTPAAAGPAAADLGWRDVFGDERLRALVALALENNRDLRVAALNVELARAQHRIQRAELLPAVGASASVTRQHLGEDLSPTGEAQTTTGYTVGVGVAAFELDLFGRVRSLSAAALERYLATEEARRAAHLSLVAEVATQYLSARALDDQVALARQTLETVESALALTRRTFEAGKTSELDLRIAEAQVQTSRFNLSRALLLRAQAQNALVLLVGEALPAELPPPQPLETQALLAELPPGVPSEVLRRRPDILAAEHALRSANASIGAARAAFFPSISLTAFGGTSSPELSGLFGAGATTWSFTPRVNLPLFTGGALRASLDVAHLRKSIEVAQYERAIQGAFREVADALVARAALDEQLEAQRARTEAEQRRYDLSELRYRKGVDSYLGVLDAQRELFAARQLLIQSRLARLVNLVDLYRALGGGWRERSAPSGGETATSGT